MATKKAEATYGPVAPVVSTVGQSGTKVYDYTQRGTGASGGAGGQQGDGAPYGKAKPKK